MDYWETSALLYKMKTTCYSNRSICKLCPLSLMINLTRLMDINLIYQLIIGNERSHRV